MPAASYHHQFCTSIQQISASEWDAVIDSRYPFLQHAFLNALETSGSVTAERGWQPQHLIIRDQLNNLIAVLPLYIKTHSYGEYVFDWSWADAYRRYGLSYYPKLVSAIPFTPATGSRLSVITSIDKNELMPLVSQVLSEKTASLNGSGWHVLFPKQSELEHWQATDAEIRLGCQFHWQNNSYNDFNQFLDDMTSRKRKDIRKERIRITSQDITIQQFTGDDITAEHWQQFYHFYQLTYARKSGHGGYLTPEFFRQIHLSMRNQLLLVMAYQNSFAIAGALYFYDNDSLYGRYWGASTDIDCLHFEVCFYQGIEFCIEHKLKRFDPGAQGEHKISRGFRPTITHSFHSIRHPEFRQAIKDFLADESAHILQYRDQCNRLLPFRQV